MADATVKIPAEHAEAFYREAVETLQYAAKNLEEGADWFEKGTRPDRLEEEDIPRVKDAISLVERARHGELEFGAEEVVCSTLEGLALHASDRVKDATEGQLASTDLAREAMAELEVWLTLLDSHPMQEVARQREAWMQARREREAVA